MVVGTFTALLDKTLLPYKVTPLLFTSWTRDLGANV